MSSVLWATMPGNHRAVGKVLHILAFKACPANH
jgi:hypothetical protein